MITYFLIYRKGIKLNMIPFLYINYIISSDTPIFKSNIITTDFGFNIM